MPELPELQAHAERLSEQFAGAPVDRFRALTFTALKTAVPDPSTAHGHRLTEVGRRGKYLLLHTDATAAGPAGTGPVTFVVHLMQGGRRRGRSRRRVPGWPGRRPPPTPRLCVRCPPR